MIIYEATKVREDEPEQCPICATPGESCVAPVEDWKYFTIRERETGKIVVTTGFVVDEHEQTIGYELDDQREITEDDSELLAAMRRTANGDVVSRIILKEVGLLKAANE
jgi:hypothetical protein